MRIAFILLVALASAALAQDVFSVVYTNEKWAVVRGSPSNAVATAVWR